ncbi:prolyl oligopeptidase family serine peptidase [Qipengyuania aquimaris]|uniref:prolyl oligopeptidase family serine peptidase n=1 Tax=Qipengyuania aquimaris TaxID=255984 RepID=UPI001C9735B7|nr:prolyl oligopeptidase family serine peptidase [Qipengyuania aquimaris]MBY6129099.1 prolyl oligopeptidase family serine peptidase [Qipengyuania aquimaris]
MELAILDTTQGRLRLQLREGQRIVWSLAAGFALAMLALHFSGAVSAQPLAAQAPKPSEIPVEAFAGRSQLNSAKLSESGSRFAFVVVEGDKRILAVHDSDTLEPLVAIDLGDREGFNWFQWAGDDRILISTRMRLTKLQYSAETKLHAFDIPTRQLHFIGFEDQGWEGDDVLHTDKDGRYVILSVSERRFTPPAVWRFPLDGSGASAAVLVQKPEKEVRQWFADDEGVVRLGMSWTSRADIKIYFRSGPDDRYRRVTKVKGGDDDALDAWDVMGIYAGRDTGYAMVDDDDGKTILREIDYSEGELGNVVYENPRWSIDSVVIRRGEGPVGVRYTDDEPRTEWLEPEMQKIQSQLEAALPGSRVRIIDSAGMDRMLVLQSGDADPGALYVFTPSRMSLELFANLRPLVDEKLLSQTQAHDIVARDGTRMRAFLTLPKDRPAKGLPMVIMPHGGPYGVRDTMVYDDWTQLLASRGYAVLRPNYRGSGGYGEAFERLGDGQIGRAMQDDIDDAYDWAVAQGFADPARVCLFGASYGGYASMWGTLRNPERYRCGASFAGVVDWEDLLAYDSQYLGRGRIRKRWYKDIWTPRITGDDEFDLSMISVSDQIARLERPLFVAHGIQDMRVPFDQFEQLSEAAEAAGVEIEMLEIEDDHYLGDSAEEARFLKALLGFLQTHNPAD